MISNSAIKTLARTVGFDLCGITQAQPSPHAEYVRGWLETGRAGSMSYLHRWFDKRVDPSKLLPGAKCVIVAALLYHQKSGISPNSHPAESLGKVAMYAWGKDYHLVVREKLSQLVGLIQERLGRQFEAKVCVDTAPVLERELAAAAGIGWIGKNTMALNQDLGSFFFLGEIITDLEIEPDAPSTDHCGTCTACLDACPTQAFPAPYEMDASRCISYWTIEHRGEIPKEFHQPIGQWVFGCDICQDACPFNRKAPTTTEPTFAIRSPGPTPPLNELLAWTPDDYRSILKDSAINRANLDMLHRNTRIAKENAERIR
ncbi:MAG: tRNA epoxyqueuosine(34) reductase QueG [Planctomycetota bacterium]